MTFPPLRTMQSLAALVHGIEGHAMDDGNVLIRHDQAHWLVTGDELDTLERLGLIELPAGDNADVAELMPTDRGRYWLRRWEKTQTRRTA